MYRLFAFLLGVAMVLVAREVVEWVTGPPVERVEPADEDGPTWEECPYVAV